MSKNPLHSTHLTTDGLGKFSRYIPHELKSHHFVIITDNKVKRLYGNHLLSHLKENGYPTDLFSFPAGERYKTRETKSKIESAMLKKNIGRDTCIIALGGGVVGDMAGFIAATYMRGVPYIQVPTTLLAIVDSSIGGKTGVNTPEGKNMIGAFYEPVTVLSDLSVLETLPKKNLLEGKVEALKIFLTCDPHSFKKAMKTTEITRPLMARAIALKQSIVAQDFSEQGLRSLLNFGHTIGHTLEILSDHRLLHGEAVGYGILLESQISYEVGLINPQEKNLIIEHFKTLGFKPSFFKKFKIKDIIALTRRDKKSRGKQIRYALLNGLGGHTLQIITDEQVQKAYEDLIHGR